MSNSSCESRGFPLAFPFPGKQKLWTPLKLFNPICSLLSFRFPFSSSKCCLFLTAKLGCNRKASSEQTLPLGQAGAALTSSSPQGERRASQRAGLPPAGLCYLKQAIMGGKTPNHGGQRLCQAHFSLSTVFRLTRDVVHGCDLDKVTSHYVQAFAATNDLQSLGKKTGLGSRNT